MTRSEKAKAGLIGRAAAKKKEGLVADHVICDKKGGEHKTLQRAR